MAVPSSGSVGEDAAQETGHPGARRYDCSDGAIDIAVESAEQWHALAVCLGRPELA